MGIGKPREALHPLVHAYIGISPMGRQTMPEGVVPLQPRPPERSFVGLRCPASGAAGFASEPSARSTHSSHPPAHLESHCEPLNPPSSDWSPTAATSPAR